jgi:hypothetical protein
MAATEVEHAALLERVVDLETELAALRPQVSELTEVKADNQALRLKVEEWKGLFLNLKRQLMARRR